MDEETIVAVYDTVRHAELAIADLKQAGIPDGAISRHTNETVTGASAVTGPAKEEGFWSRLFGGEPDHDTTVYSRSVENGASVISVRVTDAHADKVLKILESHHPVDLDERAATYAADPASHYTVPAAYAPAADVAGSASDDETIRLSEERLAVGKRVVNRGGTRIRRFVIETPVEQQVSLHEERVILERRPVTDGRAVTDADFSDKTIEMTETAEEAVVSKQAFQTEEIRLRKEVTDRVETIRDTVRKEDVEIEQIPGSATADKPYPKV
jgi:uncharacterized protein (TIGR02271 family)